MHGSNLRQVTTEEFRRYGRETVDWMADYLENIRDYPVLPDTQPGALIDRLPAAAPEQGESMDLMLEDFEQIHCTGHNALESPSLLRLLRQLRLPPGHSRRDADRGFERQRHGMEERSCCYRARAGDPEMAAAMAGSPAGVFRHHLRHRVHRHHARHRGGSRNG